MIHLIYLKKRHFFTCILLILSTPSLLFAQNTPAAEADFFDHVRYGGSLGLSFSNGFFNASIAPKAIYDFNEYASAGVGLLGSYSNASNYNAYTYGGSILGLFRPFRSLQLSAEFEELNVTREWELDGGNRKESYWYPALFLGLGYNTGPVTVGIRYDVLYDDDKSIYGNAFMPFVSVYF
ncbi:hypothetical protein GCM10007103_00970 [Salinimicrobium marinum]|uniref:Alpha-ketoglutarate decarboxylase n=1 Tax=Salinimicrobium marinum TaxID=680283 RepID=A0A918VRX8_9FLAO|nr:alpha-ketoglutarate decarboxylase [Salinimicrobium marinum]GHA23704.1 hypothetical protein GCM10007103_00970 [Salinimicrobium marinum]